MTEEEVEAPEVSIVGDWEAYRPDQDFGAAMAAGIGVSALCAVVWAIIATFLHHGVSMLAIVLGPLVALAIRKFGKGFDRKFGVLGGACAFLGCALGMLLSMLIDVARIFDTSPLEVLEAYGLDLIRVTIHNSSWFDPLFVTIAVVQGYYFAFHSDKG